MVWSEDQIQSWAAVPLQSQNSSLLAIDKIGSVHVEALIVFGRDGRMKAGGHDIPGAMPPACGVPLLGDLAIAG